MVAFRVRVPALSRFYHVFNFSINHHPKYENTDFYFQTDEEEEIFNSFEIRNYLIFHLITVVVLFIGLMDSCCE